jgi:AraC family transcriptional regulator of adaptative response / DNA-3-methyladenine glycosylase II
VAHASGFSSLRRFNAAFAVHYRLSPSGLRRLRPPAHPAPVQEGVSVRLGYRPPYDVAGMRRFLAGRAIPEMESVDGDADTLVLRRTLRVVHDGRVFAGWIEARFDTARHEVVLQVSAPLVPALAAVLDRLRHGLDLDADPSLIDPLLTPLPVPARPGVRVPGAFDGFESAVRVVLGQQVSVAAARTLARRLLAAFGEPLSTPWPALARLFPSPQVIACADAAAIGRLGIVRQRVGALQAMARAVVDGRLDLQRSAPLEPTLQALRALPGIGEWTAQMIAMRVLAWPDALPDTDIGVLRALQTRDPAQVRAAAEACRPWRSYAVVRLWQTLEDPR